MSTPNKGRTKFHVALGVSNIERSVEDYSRRLGQQADVIIPDEYALWRTQTLNVSIRKVPPEKSGTLRHLGWELDGAENFSTETDSNNILWEYFSADQQADEIAQTWPGISYRPQP